MNLEDSADAVTDHRIALMQKWAADPKLMAQVGVLQADLGEMHLGPAARMRTRNEKLAVADAHQPSKTIQKKNKKAKKLTKQSLHLDLTGQEAMTIIKQQAHANYTMPTEKKKKKKKSKHNPYIDDKTMTARDIDTKVSSQIQEYDDLIQHTIPNIQELIGHIPDSYSGFKQKARNSLAVLTQFTTNKLDFRATYLSIAEGLYTYVRIPPKAFHKYYKVYAYPVFNFQNEKLKVMQEGYLAHEISSMLHNFIKMNLSTAFKLHEEHFKIHIKQFEEHVKKINTCYRELIKLKSALDSKVKSEKQADPQANHRNIKNLKEDVEELLTHDATFKMGQPFE
jgi:hypothetical protein